MPPKPRPVFDAVSVNGVTIDEADILTEAQNHPAENPGAALLSAARALAVRELLLQRAREIGIEPEHEKDAEGRAETDEDALVRMVIEREVDVPSASRDEAQRYYENNRHRFTSAPILEASHILIAADPADQETRDAARQTATRLAAAVIAEPATFASVALEYSSCPSGAQGGNLGQLTRGSTVPEFERALERMTPGETTANPIESRFGYHIVRLDRRVEGEELPFDYVADKIAGWLEASTWSKAVSQYIAILAAEAEITGIDLLSGEDGGE
ncbi:peptidylprolyl isomerase [Brucella melitensis]|uniref:Parvulin-like PPIase n=1 Tax=Brucella melitensis biotype 1 (strain ATCC 23456 / CCUG 17765 / NCTC 10094 / 16M) TaxID=224914 RepID=Q8YBE6_BRUME|nr:MULTISPECIES: peptidylprolyl isomerase [Brucella]EPZ76763.1 peptidyl-prolyl cis-trans isomerase [Brucella melitensis ADMAS-G1]RUR04342.1 peptidylprolyl isomerase [Brucella abortus]AAL54196.1 peptidyl-prolyl cis-trans isomerase c [Brucella melitensis bv. 1 str. 16M]AIJ87934.1 PPIC-type PPIASE domain protein [Brucella melitensis bv. 1 str. 16M]ARY44983.1 peptidylprolyl isomerase [Brucella melitensis]